MEVLFSRYAKCLDGRQEVANRRIEALRQWAELGNNVCGVLHDYRDAPAVAARFVGAGWSARSSSWYGYEVETSWGQVEIDPIDGPDILLNGVVDPERLDELGRLLSSFAPEAPGPARGPSLSLGLTSADVSRSCA